MMMKHFNEQAVVQFRSIQQRELYKLLNSLLDSPKSFNYHIFRCKSQIIDIKNVLTYGC